MCCFFIHCIVKYFVIFICEKDDINKFYLLTIENSTLVYLPKSQPGPHTYPLTQQGYEPYSSVEQYLCTYIYEANKYNYIIIELIMTLL